MIELGHTSHSKNAKTSFSVLLGIDQANDDQGMVLKYRKFYDSLCSGSSVRGGHISQ